MSHSESKVRCCKEWYCIGTSNVGSMNQRKLEVVKEMARVNIDILGIGELKWMGMGKFNSNDHYIYYCGWESLRRNGVALRVNKSLKCCTWVQSQKWHNDLCSFSRQTIQHHSNPSLSQLLMLKKLKLNGSMKTYRPSRTNTKKDVLFIIGLEYKSRKSRDTWNNKQAWPWSTKWSRASLTEFC